MAEKISKVSSWGTSRTRSWCLRYGGEGIRHPPIVHLRHKSLAPRPRPPHHCLNCSYDRIVFQHVGIIISTSVRKHGQGTNFPFIRRPHDDLEAFCWAVSSTSFLATSLEPQGGKLAAWHQVLCLKIYPNNPNIISLNCYRKTCLAACQLHLYTAWANERPPSSFWWQCTCVPWTKRDTRRWSNSHFLNAISFTS